MQVSRVAPPIDVRAVLAELRRSARLLGLAFVPPLGVALLAGEGPPAIHMAGIVLAGVLLGGRLGPERKLGTQDGLVFTALVYLLFSLAGAVAYLPVAPFLDGFFDAMSGFTTTGLGVIDVETLPQSLLFLRAYSQWLGGAGIVVLSILFLPGPRASLSALYSAEFKEENLLGNMVATTRLVFKIYGALTIAGFVAFVSCGMAPFDALLYVLSTLSTGGFSPHPDSLGHYASLPIRMAVIVFMIAGAVAFPLYYRAGKEGLRRLGADPQLRALGILIAVPLAVVLVAAGTLPTARAASESLLHVVSAITTTGFYVTDAGSWSEGWRLGALVLMIVGGSAGSTAGGLKLARLLVAVGVATWSCKRALLPAEAKLPIHQADRIVGDEEIKALLGFSFVYLTLIGVSTAALSLGGFAPVDALFESTSALGTVGLSSGITSASLPAWAKLLLAVDMWAGRLEVLPLVVLFYPRRARSRGRSS